MKKVLKWLDNNLEEVILATLLAVMACVMFMQICRRFLIHNTLIWPEELARDCFIYTAFFCIPMCIRRGTMLKVDILVESLPKSIRKWMIYLGDIVTLVIVVILWRYSFDVLANARKVKDVSQTMGFDMVWIYGMPVFAFGLAVFRGIQHVIRRGKIVFSGVEEQEKDEAEELIEQAREDLEQSADKQGVK